MVYQGEAATEPTDSTNCVLVRCLVASGGLYDENRTATVLRPYRNSGRHLRRPRHVLHLNHLHSVLIYPCVIILLMLFGYAIFVLYDGKRRSCARETQEAGVSEASTIR